MGSTSPPTLALVGGRDTQSLRRGLWKRQRSNFGGRRTLSQNTTIIDHIGERWAFAYPHAKSPIARLYGAYRAILLVGLVAVNWTMILFVKYSRVGVLVLYQKWYN